MSKFIILEHPDCVTKTYTLKLSDGLIVKYNTTNFGPIKLPTNSNCKGIRNAIKSLKEKGWEQKS